MFHMYLCAYKVHILPPGYVYKRFSILFWLFLWLGLLILNSQRRLSHLRWAHFVSWLLLHQCNIVKMIQWDLMVFTQNIWALPLVLSGSLTVNMLLLFLQHKPTVYCVCVGGPAYAHTCVLSGSRGTAGVLAFSLNTIFKPLYISLENQHSLAPLQYFKTASWLVLFSPYFSMIIAYGIGSAEPQEGNCKNWQGY